MIELIGHAFCLLEGLKIGGGRREGKGRGRDFVSNVGEGFDVNPPAERKNGNPNQRNEIEEWRRQISTLTEMVQRLQPP